jgi:hypothetical protein
MRAGHLLLASIVLCTLPAVAQDSPLLSEHPNSKVLQAPEFRTPPAATPNEPWRIIPKSGKDKSFLITPEMDSDGILASADGPAADFTCLSIRSYVVKRDSKNSDSVHPAGYSTCIPARRFRLKTAEARDAVSLTR